MCVIISIWCFLKNKKTTYSPKRKQMSKLILEVPKCSHAKNSPAAIEFREQRGCCEIEFFSQLHLGVFVLISNVDYYA